MVRSSANIENLPMNPYNSNLRGLDIPFDEVAYYLMDYFNLLDIMYVDQELFTRIDKVLLSTEDRICQDMGFVKIAINSRLKTLEVVVPNPIFGKQVTGAQRDVVDALSVLFNLNIDEKLKQEQKENMKLATKIKAILSVSGNKII